jgi:outer membrane protein assembly factor BamB
MFEGYSKLYALNPNGTRKWTLDMASTASGLYEPFGTATQPYTNASAWSEPVVGPDGTIYASTDDPHIRAVAPDGTLKWTRRCGTHGGFTLTVGADGLIYACGDDKSMYVLRPDGTLASVFNGTGWLSYPVVGEGGKVYVSDSAGALWTIGTDCSPDARDLKRMWDLAGARAVDFADFAVMAADWTRSATGYYMPGDVNRDGYVDAKDAAIMAANWLSEE